LFFRSCKGEVEDWPQCIRTDNPGRLHSFGPLPYAVREENRSVRSSHARTDGQVSRQQGREEYSDAIQDAGSRFKGSHERQKDSGSSESAGNADVRAIIAVPNEDGFDSDFMIEGYEQSAAEISLVGAV
jgi:hypothetical protein